MERVFGLPAGPLSIGLAIALVLALGALTALAARNLVFVRMGLRNIPRRRARSALIVTGLMLGTTIIASALFTGDTMATTVRGAVIESLGPVDETVTAGADTGLGDLALDAARPYFDAAAAVAAVDAAVVHLPVDAVAPAIVEPVGAQHRAAGRTEPRVTLVGIDADRAAAFGLEEVASLDAGEILLDTDAAQELDASAGSAVLFLAGEHLVELRVAAVDDLPATTTDGPAAVLPLAVVQDLLGRSGEVNHVFVSNTGGDTDGVERTDEVLPALDGAVAPLGLVARAAKEHGLEDADAAGNAFVQLFTTFGSFSMAAGVLLIFLIFVMLAAERRPEMGMARAVGTQRRHLVQIFLYEGAAYDVVAAAIGAVLGIGVSYVMVRVVGSAFAAQDIEMSFTMTPRSLVIAYSLGVLLTLVVVTMSASRVSRLNIVSAIRDLPEPVERSRRRSRWVLPVLGVAVGGLMAAGGATGRVYVSWMMGVSIVIISLMPVVRSRTRSERAAYTSAAVALLVLWTLPLSTFDALFGEMAKDFSIWIASGLIVVVAATWLVTYNADVLLGIGARAAAPFRSLRPIARMAVAYPLKSRFRTGVTMSMFMLVVFTLVTGSTIPAAFVRSFDDVEQFGGGFDVRVTVAPATAVDDLRPDLPVDVADDIVAIGTQSFVPVEARQADADREMATYAVRGVDEGFLDRSTYRLAATARGYDSPREVWAALAETPGLAVVDPLVAPRRDRWGVYVLPDFQLSGFYVEDGTFDPVPVAVHDPLTDQTLELTVIGVLSDNAPLTMAGITVSNATLAPFGDRATPTVHHLAVRDGADPDAMATAIESALLNRGGEAETYERLLDDAVGSSMLFIRLVQGFMGLGLVVGVAALGVVSARAVVERRQQIGMLRAIGFQAATVRRGLVAETAIVAGTAIFAGTALGLLVSFNVIVDAQQQPGNAGLAFSIPWLNLGVVFALVIAAAICTTLLTSLRATRIYPAEALRYQ